MKEKEKKLALNTIIFAIGTIGSKAISFLLVPLYTNVLTTSEYGVADLITTITSILLPIFSLCLGESVLYYGIKNESKDENDSLFKNGIIVILVGCLLLGLLSPLFIFYETLSSYLFFLTAYAILEIIRYFLREYTKAIGKNKLYSIDSIIYAFVFAITNILFLLVFNFGITGYLWSYIICEGFSVLFLFIFANGLKAFQNGKFNKQTIKLIISYSAPLILNSISWAVVHSCDRFMLDAFLSSDAVGLYSAGSKLPTLVNSIVTIFCQAWTLSAYIEYGKGDTKFYSKILDTFSFVLLIFASCVLLIDRPFMYVYVGEDFRNSMIYVPLLMLGVVYQNYAAYFGSIIQSGKRNIFMMVSTLTSVVINIFANYFLIRAFDIQGACLATCLSFLIVAILRFVFSRKIVKFDAHVFKTLIMNALLALQAVCVIFEFYFVIVSIVVIIIFLLLNINLLKDFKNLIASFFNRFKKCEEGNNTLIENDSEIVKEEKDEFFDNISNE